MRGSSRVPSGPYTLEKAASEGARAALTEGVNVAPAGEGWRAVTSDAPIQFPDLLIATVRLRGRERAEIGRKPKRLIILERDEGHRLFVECERVSLARENIVLAHNSLADDVDEALSECAADGWRRWEPQELRGLPDDWIAWTGVEMMSIPAVERQPELAALVPVEWTKLVVDGGISLPGRSTWLSERLPQVRITTVVEKQLVISLEQTMSLAAGSFATGELGTFTGAAVAELPDLPEGDYRVTVRDPAKSGSTLVSASFRVRSADFPRVDVDAEGVLAHVRGAPAAAFALSATRVDALEPPYVAGGAVEPAASLPPEQNLSPSTLELVAPLDLETESDPEAVTAATTSTPPCLLGGNTHVFRLEEAGRELMLRRKRATKIDARCSICGFEKWFPPHTSAAKGFRNAAKPTILTIGRPATASADAPAEKPMAATLTAEARDYDTLLAALTYARGGSWSLYERLASQVGEEPWFAAESSRTLSALGHIEVAADLRQGGRPTGASPSRPSCGQVGRRSSAAAVRRPF